MPRKPRAAAAAQLSEVTFRCQDCRHTFVAAPARIEDAAELEHHPYRYVGICPTCGAEAEQAAYERGLLKAWARATGPRTAEGKAAVTKNLEGHPTPEEAKRTRFNAMKHGLYARAARYFPAKPDGYAFCSSCEVGRAHCAAQPACVKQTEIFMLHHAAFDQKRPEVLGSMYADFQASLMAILQQLLQTVIADGVKISRPCFDFDKEGGFHLAEYEEDGKMHRIMEISAHPLLKPLSDLLSKNNLSLADMGMTMRSVEEEARLPGQLQGDHAPALGEDEYRRRQLAAIEGLTAQMTRAKQRVESDPIYRDVMREQGGEVIDVEARDV